jgi:hypothetical protein
MLRSQCQRDELAVLDDREERAGSSERHIDMAAQHLLHQHRGALEMNGRDVDTEDQLKGFNSKVASPAAAAIATPNQAHFTPLPLRLAA